MGKKVVLVALVLTLAFAGAAFAASADLSNGVRNSTVTTPVLGTFDLSALSGTGAITFTATVHNVSNLTPAGAGKFQLRVQRTALTTDAIVVEWDGNAAQPSATYDIGTIVPGGALVNRAAADPQGVQPNFATDNHQYKVTYVYTPGVGNAATVNITVAKANTSDPTAATPYTTVFTTGALAFTWGGVPAVQMVGSLTEADVPIVSTSVVLGISFNLDAATTTGFASFPANLYQNESFSGQTIGTVVLPASSRARLSVTFTNAGTTTWTAAAGYGCRILISPTWGSNQTATDTTAPLRAAASTLPWLPAIQSPRDSPRPSPSTWRRPVSPAGSRSRRG